MGKETKEKQVALALTMERQMPGLERWLEGLGFPSRDKPLP